MKNTRNVNLMIFSMFLVLLFSGCAPGTDNYVKETAGFLDGLWHGLICLITLIISIFSDSVRMYEVRNTGFWYDLGFMFGAVVIFGGSWKSRRIRKQKTRQEQEWEEIGAKVEHKVKMGINSWVEESGKSDAEWEEIGRKIEEKIKRELRNWAEK